MKTFSFECPLAWYEMLDRLNTNGTGLVWTAHESEGEEEGIYLNARLDGERIRIVKERKHFVLELWSESLDELAAAELQESILGSLLSA